MARYPLSQWRNIFNARVAPAEQNIVSMVYKLFTSSTREEPHYVGRSDNPSGRINAHIAANGNCCRHRITHVEFTIVRNSAGNRDRKRKSYEKECRLYHEHSPNCNTIHPRKDRRAWNCPSRNCDF